MIEKNMITNAVLGLVSLTCFSVLGLSSCNDGTEARDADYPAQSIYLPAAGTNGQFVIDDITRKKGVQPIDGFLYRYVVDKDANRFIVPLSVYRAGVNNKGSFKVNIDVDNSSVDALNQGRDEATALTAIPEDKYSLVNSVEMKNGDELAKFYLNIDLDYLLSNYPDKRFALGIRISSDKREVKANLSSVTVIIHSAIMKPTAQFTLVQDGANVTFKNSSLMAEKYVWEFGDGTYSGDESPVHTYQQPGTYEIKLNAVGITGNDERSVQTAEVTIIK